MALNFPNSPTNGQLYTDTMSGNSWTWDSANTCWKSTSTYIQTITVASSAPGTPAVGQLWWNQDYGRLLVYYSDGTSSQWVDASPSDYTSELAFNKANNALANATGTFAGALSIVNPSGYGLSVSANTAYRAITFNSDGVNGIGTVYQNSANDFGWIGSSKWAYNGNLGDFAVMATANLTFASGLVERGRFDSAGYFMVNRSTRMYGGSVISANGWVAIKQTGADAYGYVAEALNNDRWIRIGHDGNTAIVGSTYNVTGGFSPLTFHTNDAERVRITTTGSVGINTIAPQSQLAVVSNTSTAYVTADSNYYSSAYPHELTIQNNQQNTTNTFCGIFFQAGQTSWQNGINAGRLSFVRDSNNSYGGNFTFSNRLTADGTMREVMRLDQGGRLTLPNHPSFHVYDATGTDFASEAKNTNLTGVSWNNGSYYNTSTQRFTAPVAGYYYFYYRTNMSNARNPKQTVIYVNGSPKLRGYNYDTSTWSETAAIGIWYLAVNDYVEFYYQGDPDAGLTWNYAGGYLIG